MKILTLLPLIGHPRNSKRISMLINEGFEVEVGSFIRDYHKGRIPKCEITELGKIQHGQYFKRFLLILLSIHKVRKLISRNDVIYCSGMDMAFLAVLSNFGYNKPIIQEIGDIREAQVSENIKGRIIRVIDKFILKKCAILVTTTQSFYEEYYKKRLRTKIINIVIENKLENQQFGTVKQSNKNLEFPIKIGYFGLLRDEWSLKVLYFLIKTYPSKFKLLLAGIPFDKTEQLLSDLKLLDGVDYFGSYNSPNDLPTLYNSVDMVWSCYPPIRDEDWNLKWARPNRFYESCYFQKPTFTREGCQDSFDVKKFNIGKIIKGEEINDVVNEILAIKLGEVIKWSSNMRKLPPSIYTYTKESVVLKNEILKIGSNSK
jgi:succinoglycan biosynthesis protein ExoL